ncbi:MAG: L-threonylcarbamoyladenylate synthase [Rhodoferax sp.]|nr:L-threonylcarbamoyladenylate synthase [Rhodoferax sp.]
MIRPGDDTNSIAAAADCIRAGGLIGLPTETVYGLAADADNDRAVAQIFAAKGRPVGHPLIVHIANVRAARHFTADVPDFAAALMQAFWPGPLTLILLRRPGVASAAAGGHPTIGLRCPAHPVALALLNWGQSRIDSANPEFSQKEFDSDPNYFLWGLAAPSANQFGRVSPTTAGHVRDELGDELLILDGGSCGIGIESTIIDCSRGAPVLLRPGAISPAQVEAACGHPVLQKEALPTHAAPAPKAPGTLESHYAPRARLRLMTGPALQQAWGKLTTRQRSRLALWWRSGGFVPSGQLSGQPMPQQAADAAQQLFAVLRHFDHLGADQIWVETPPDLPEWDGVRDRLQRAAGS